VKRLALLSLLVVVAVGCGGGKHANPLQVSGVPSSADCDKKGISTDAAREGACVVGLTAITAANRDHWLRMKDYAVRVAGVRTATHLGNRASVNFMAGGEFVVVTLRVKNVGPAAERFDRNSKLAFLLVDGTEYLEVPGAEDELLDSFHAHGKVIKPGRIRSGTVVFDPPQEHAKNVRAEGSHLVFLNAEDSGNGYPRLGFRAIGFIRLWK
jgi:hypothetical protein